MPDYLYPSSAAPPVQPHTRTHTVDLFGQNSFSRYWELKSERSRHWMDRAPAAWWLPATVAGVSKRGIRMPDYLYPSSAAPLVQPHTRTHTVDLFGQNSFSRYWELKSRGLATGWTELLRRGGCLLPSPVSRKGGYVCLTTFTRAPQHPLCNRTHAHTHSRLVWATFLLPILGAEKQRSRHWMDRAPAAWWLPATVAGVSKRGIRMPDYLYPSSAAPPVQPPQHTHTHHSRLVWAKFLLPDIGS